MYVYTCYNVNFLASEVRFSRTYERVREAFGLITKYFVTYGPLPCRSPSQVFSFLHFVCVPGLLRSSTCELRPETFVCQRETVVFLPSALRRAIVEISVAS